MRYQTILVLVLLSVICLGLGLMTSIVHASPVGTPIIEQTFVNNSPSGGCSFNSATSFLQNDLLLAFLSINNTNTNISPTLGAPQGPPTMNGLSFSQIGFTRTLSNIEMFEYWMVLSTTQTTAFACSLSNSASSTNLLLIGIKNANLQAPLANLFNTLGAPYNSGGGTTPSLYLNSPVGNTLLVFTVASCDTSFNTQTPTKSWTNENFIAVTTPNCPSNGWYLETDFTNATSAAQGYSAIGTANQAQWGSLGAVVCPLSGCQVGGQNNNGQGNSQGPFQSVAGPGGVGIPPQLADQNVLGYVFFLSAAIALSSIRVERKKKTERRLRLG